MCIWVIYNVMYLCLKIPFVKEIVLNAIYENSAYVWWEMYSFDIRQKISNEIRDLLTLWKLIN